MILVEATDKFGGTTAYSPVAAVLVPGNPVLKRAGNRRHDRGRARVLPRRRRRPDPARAAGHLRQGRRSAGRVPRAGREPQVRDAAVARLLRQDAEGPQRLPAPHDADAAADLRGSVRPAQARPRTARLRPARRRPARDADRRPRARRSLPQGDRQLPKRKLNLNTPLVELWSRTAPSSARSSSVTASRSRSAPQGRGVILAAGGFEGNDELRQKYGVPGCRARTRWVRGATSARTRPYRGRADTDLMDQAWWSPGRTHPDGRSAFAAVLHRRHLRQRRRQALRQRVRAVRPPRPRHHRGHGGRLGHAAVTG